ncbi:GNAT family N-acetyltransferase [Algoriphagus namhaensis]|uniref:GNAT family N-acetyltransferase n=1 Tax=Algoriphagus namhaensis TaxID=915353 RepID=A0ABV8ASH7_9BACT
MIIRPAQDSDIPAIIDLLSASLGDSLIPKTESLWKWKHQDNPFGTSPVLLAEEGSTLVGLRAFLKWEFEADGKIYFACRAVDTATHPDHQGKGIFKKLTSTLLDEVGASGIDFIYNTPNKKSTPGYLKMGWEKWGKLPLKLQFHVGTGNNQHPLDPAPWSSIAPLVAQLESPASQNETGAILKPGYLKWRYLDCPLFPYYFLTDHNSFLIFYRIKESRLGRELRTCDLFTFPSFGENQKKMLHEQLREAQKSSGARFTSSSGLKYPHQNALNLGTVPILAMGPLVTFRKLQPHLDPKSLPWQWSLGDLELF